MEWQQIKFGEALEINPYRPLQKGRECRSVAMDQLDPFTRKIHGFEYRPFNGGSKFVNGDTLLARITPCLENGKTAYVDILDDGEVAWGSTEFLVLAAKPGITDPLFIYYLTISPQIRSAAISSMVGTSGRQRVQTDVLANRIISLPPLAEQCRIAGILGAFDDQIEVLRQQNRTLEAMARALFRHWFVDFEFPSDGSGGVPAGQPYRASGGRMKDSPLGEIPEDWEVVSLNDILTIISGGTPQTSVPDYWGGDIPWFSVVDAPKGGDVFCISTEKTITQAGLENSPAQLVPKWTIIISARGTVGKIAVAAQPMSFNQSCYGLEAISGYTQPFLLNVMYGVVDKLSAASHGSVFSTITKQTFSGIVTPLPEVQIVETWNEIVFPIYEKILSNNLMAQKYALTRDALLVNLLK